MIIALLLVVGLAWWLHREGVLLPNVRRLGVVAGSGLIAWRLIETGQVFAGLLAAAGAAAWWRWTMPREAARSAVAAAEAMLTVEPRADARAIHVAWRRAMAAAHPDAGGSAERSRRMTAARDLLLSERLRAARDRLRPGP